MTLDQALEEFKLEGNGRWIRSEDREPPKPGDYCVIRRRQGGKYFIDGLHFSGDYWITHGHSPTQTVGAWWEVGA